MKRNVMEKLLQWKEDPERKPLILRGARQVGKTWLMKEFGRVHFSNCVYFNFDEETGLQSIFQNNKDPHRIVELLSLLGGEKIIEGKTLLLLDEIQECTEALNSLKYFKEKAKGYYVIAAGSLLGTMLAKPQSYPVGMVNLLDIRPLTFDEYLLETNPNLYSYYISLQKGQSIEEIFHQKLLDAYGIYLIVGGMPEAVSSWVQYKDIERVERIQQELLLLYESDFAKHHSRIEAGRILLVFRSLASQLAKPNEKFMYGAVKKGARAREFEDAIEWLVSAGMVNRIHNVSKPEHPLPVFDLLDQFKLYFFDTGLIRKMAGLSNEAILLKTSYQFKGPLTENFVLQQLLDSFPVTPRYYSNKTGEIDFLLQNGSEIIPLEVKGGEDKSAPSFKRFIVERHPLHAFRLSKRNYCTDGEFTNLPVYLAGRLKDFI